MSKHRKRIPVNWDHVAAIAVMVVCMTAIVIAGIVAS